MKKSKKKPTDFTYSPPRYSKPIKSTHDSPIEPQDFNKKLFESLWDDAPLEETDYFGYSTHDFVGKEFEEEEDWFDGIARQMKEKREKLKFNDDDLLKRKVQKDNKKLLEKLEKEELERRENQQILDII